MKESDETHAGNESAWKVYHETFTDNIHNGDIRKAFHVLKDEFTNYACTNANPESVANYWQTFESRLNRLDPNALPKLSLVYGSEMDAEITNGTLQVNHSLLEQAPCKRSSFDLLEDSMMSNLAKQYDQLKEPKAFTFSSIFFKGPEGPVTKSILDKHIEQLNRNIPFVPVE